MTFQDPTTGDSLSGANASVPPLMGYGADSTLFPPSGSDVTTSGERGTSGAGFVGAQVSEHPAETEETPPEGSMDVFEATTWNMRRTGLVAGVVVAGLAAGAGIAWLVISRRRASILAAQAAELAQGRSLLSPAVARQRISDALESGADLSARAWQSARDLGIAASALAESALTLAQDARDRATQASQLMRDQTVSASQTAQNRITDTWGRTRDTATTSWDAATETAHRARVASIRTARSARAAARMAARTAQFEGRRTAKTAQRGFARAQRAAKG